MNYSKFSNTYHHQFTYNITHWATMAHQIQAEYNSLTTVQTINDTATKLLKLLINGENS